MKKILFLLMGSLIIGCSSSADKFVGTWVNDDCGSDFPVKIFKEGDVYKISFRDTAAQLMGQKNPKPAEYTLTSVDNDTLAVNDGMPFTTTLKMVKNNEFYSPLFGCSRSGNYHRITNN